MSEERGMINGGGGEARLDRLSEEMAEVKGTVVQMDKRVSNLENMRRRAFGVLVGTWVTLVLAVLGLYFRS